MNKKIEIGDTVVHPNGNSHIIIELATRCNGVWYCTYPGVWWYGETLTWNEAYKVWEALT